MSAQTTFAPSAANRRAVARPMPPPAPVTTATLPVSRSDAAAMTSHLSRARSTRGDEDVLRFGERKRRIWAELPAETGRLEAPERRPVPHRRMRVHRQIAGLDAAADPKRAADVTRPDRSRQAEVAVVRDPDRVRLVVERHHRDDRPEDLLTQHPVGRV